MAAFYKKTIRASMDGLTIRSRKKKVHPENRMNHILCGDATGLDSTPYGGF